MPKVRCNTCQFKIEPEAGKSCWCECTNVCAKIEDGRIMVQAQSNTKYAYSLLDDEEREIELKESLDDPRASNTVLDDLGEILTAIEMEQASIKRLPNQGMFVPANQEDIRRVLDLLEVIVLFVRKAKRRKSKPLQPEGRP